MVRTTRRGVRLLAALASLAGLCVTRTPAAEPLPDRAGSVVAQSTESTAGTGRRPIAERIAASNLPSRPVVAEPLAADDGPLAEAAALATALDEEPAPQRRPARGARTPAAAKTAAVVQAAAETGSPRKASAAGGARQAAATSKTASTRAPSRPAETDKARLLKRVDGALAGQASPSAPTALAPAASAAARPIGSEATAPGPARPRLEFDVRESRSTVEEGEQIVMRIAVRNVGGVAAERVTAALFFAEGVEPVKAIGHAAEVKPGEVRLATVPELAPGSSVDVLVTAVGTQTGSVAYRAELACGHLPGLIAREGAVKVHHRRAPLH